MTDAQLLSMFKWFVGGVLGIPIVFIMIAFAIDYLEPKTHKIAKLIDKCYDKKAEIKGKVEYYTKEGPELIRRYDEIIETLKRKFDDITTREGA